MKRVTEIVGKKVVTTENGERLGRVNDVLLDTASARLVGLVVSRHWFTDEEVLPFARVQTFGPAAVLVDSASSLVGAEAWDRRKLGAIRCSRLNGKEVVTATGSRLGILTDLVIDERTGCVNEVEVGDNATGMLKQWSRIPCSQDVRIGRDAVVVPTGGG
jgi:sporulation protein YlmC with PRC-barrel domain